MVSVILPVYNGEEYLAEALSSVLMQQGVEFEVIVVDDGSEDPEAISSIVDASSDPRVRLVRQPNAGVASALNAGIREARGQYFSWLSHDDCFLPGKLSRQVSLMRSNADQASLILFSDYEVMDDKGRTTGRAKMGAGLAAIEGALGPIQLGAINGCTVLMQLDGVRELGGFDEHLKCTQDYDLWLRAVQAGYAFIHDSRATVRTRVHAMQASNTSAEAAPENRALWQRIAEELIARNANRTVGQQVHALRQFSNHVSRSDYLRAVGLEAVWDLVERRIQTLLSAFRVTVVIPTKDRPHKTYRALSSVRGQTHANVEVVLVNDSANPLDDSLIELIGSYGLDCEVVDYPGSRGASFARNVGISHATGQFVAFLDSDDEFLPQKISATLEELVALEADLAHTDYLRCDAVDGTTSLVSTVRHAGQDQARVIAMGCSIALPTVVIRLDALRTFAKVPEPERREFFPEGVQYGEDAVAWLTLISRSTSPLVHVPQALSRINVNHSSAFRNNDALKCAEEVLRRQADLLGLDPVGGHTRSLRALLYSSLLGRRWAQRAYVASLNYRGSRELATGARRILRP